MPVITKHVTTPKHITLSSKSGPLTPEEHQRLVQALDGLDGFEFTIDIGVKVKTSS